MWTTKHMRCLRYRLPRTPNVIAARLGTTVTAHAYPFGTRADYDERVAAIAVEREGMTLVALKMYFNERGRAKVEVAVAKGKKLHDKRETDKKRDWNREKSRLMRVKG